MLFFDSSYSQVKKSGYMVCGDMCVCERTPERTVFILCDGIGSGVYANISASTCASRLSELIRLGVAPRTACEMVASSMHRARTESIPFAGFSAAILYSNGNFTIYTYESPEPILIKDRIACVLKSVFYTAGYETLGEINGNLEIGDSLILCSDGVSQAGLGHGYPIGLTQEGTADFINRELNSGLKIKALPEQISSMCSDISGGVFEDDTTACLLTCREPEILTVLTGPPLNKDSDKECVRLFLEHAGKKAICGSSTANMFARETNKEVEMLDEETSFFNPPEYLIEGIDLTSEGTLMLNQVYNIIDEFEQNCEGSVAEKFCSMLNSADVINFMLGRSENFAHKELAFRLMGVRLRSSVVELLAGKLKKMGKLVTERYF